MNCILEGARGRTCCLSPSIHFPPRSLLIPQDVALKTVFPRFPCLALDTLPGSLLRRKARLAPVLPAAGWDVDGSDGAGTAVSDLGVEAPFVDSRGVRQTCVRPGKSPTLPVSSFKWEIGFCLKCNFVFSVATAWVPVNTVYFGHPS